MLPTYNVYVRVYAKKTANYPVGHVRFSAKVAGTTNDLTMSKMKQWVRVGTYAGVSMPTAVKQATAEYNSDLWAGRRAGETVVTGV